MMNLVSRVTATLICGSWLAAAGVQVRTPLTFEPNIGQAPSEVQWLSRTPNRTLLLTRDEALMLMNSGASIRMRLLGAKTSTTEGLNKLPSTSSYFTGNKPSSWRIGVPHYERV